MTTQKTSNKWGTAGWCSEPHAVLCSNAKCGTSIEESWQEDRCADDMGSRDEVQAAFYMFTKWATENNFTVNKQNTLQMVLWWDKISINDHVKCGNEKCFIVVVFKQLPTDIFWRDYHYLGFTTRSVSLNSIATQKKTAPTVYMDKHTSRKTRAQPIKEYSTENNQKLNPWSKRLTLVSNGKECK